MKMAVERSATSSLDVALVQAWQNEATSLQRFLAGSHEGPPFSMGFWPYVVEPGFYDSGEILTNKEESLNSIYPQDPATASRLISISFIMLR